MKHRYEMTIIQTRVSGNDKLPVEFPMICQSDYETDDEFGDMYR